MAERRKYIEVQVPLLRENLRLLGTIENLHNMTIKLDLTRKMRGKGMTVTLRILNNEGKLYAFPNNIELVKSYIKRMMRKRTDYVEDSFTTRAVDVQVNVKPFLITRKRVSRAVRKNLRNTAKEFLVEYIRERNYNELCRELMNGTLQKALLPKLKKVYPLSFCDLRVFGTKEIDKLDINNILKTAEEEHIEIEEENTEEKEDFVKDNEKTNEEEKEEENTEEKEEEDDKSA